MSKKSPVSVLLKPVHQYAALAVLVGGVVLAVIAFAVAVNSKPTAQNNQQTMQVPTTTTATPSLTPVPHPAIAIPPADWLSNSYQYYDSNLDATFTIPNGWIIVNDPSAAGLSMPGVRPQPINACYPSEKEFFKDFSQCQSTLGYALKIAPNSSPQNRNFLVLMGISNGFGGSCNQAVSTGDMALYDAHVSINNNPYVVTTGVTTKLYASFPSAGIHLDCYYWPKVSETGVKSPWAMFNVRHEAADDATFITEMQILENIKLH